MTDKTDFWEGLVTIQYQGQAVVKKRLYAVSGGCADVLNVHRPAHYDFEKVVAMEVLRVVKGRFRASPTVVRCSLKD